MSSQVLGAILLLSQHVCGNDNDNFIYAMPLREGVGKIPQTLCKHKWLEPRELTATALNSTAIRVTWKKPSCSGNLNGQYELTLYNSTHEEEFNVQGTEDIITDLEPSSTYDVKVSARWCNGTAVDAYASTSVTTLSREISTPLASESSSELEAEEFSSTEESTDVLVDFHNESSLDKSSFSSTDSQPEVEKEGKVTEEDEENTVGGGKDELPSDSHTSESEAKDGASFSSTDSQPEVEKEGKVTEEDEENTVGGGKDELPSDSHTSESEAKDGEFSETDETGNKPNTTLSPESPKQPNSSKVIKGSLMSVVGFCLLWLSLVIAL